jgi:lysophospholipase L1-like esterase
MTLDPSRPAKLLFIGDSITDCGRLRPVGEGVRDAPLGNGYVALIEARRTATSPGHRQRIVNMGVSGDTVRGLAVRWDADVLALQPDHVVILIGINDVWRAFTRRNWIDWQIGPDEYRTTLEDLVRQARDGGADVTIASPYFLEPNRQDPMREMMDRYGAIAREVAAGAGLTFVDLQAAFDHALTRLHPMELAWDRVHPNLAGHMIIADALYGSLFGT